MLSPLTNKNYSQVGSKFNPTLLLLLVCVASFTFVQASAQESETGYNLRIRTEPSILFIDGGGFYLKGITVSIDEAPETWREYTFVGWKVDGIWADGNPITIRMDGPHTVTAVYSKEIGGSILVDAIPRIAEITVDGTIFLPSEFIFQMNFLYRLAGLMALVMLFLQNLLSKRVPRQDTYLIHGRIKKLQVTEL